MCRAAVRSARVDPFRPVSREQEGLWLLEQSRSIGAANNLPFALALEGDIDRRRLRQAFGQLVERQPALRMEFSVSAGRLRCRQRPSTAARVDLEVLEVLSDSDADIAATASCTRPLDPLRWPAFRASLISGPGQRHVLLIVVHHCVMDGGSLEPLLGDLMALYERGTGPPVKDPPSGDLLARFVADEREAVETESKAAEAYWSPLLAEVVDTPQLTRAVPGTGGRGRAISVELEIASSLRDGLLALATNCHTSVFITLLASLQAIQYRYAGEGDAEVATAVAMDTRPRYASGVPGMFANEAPLVSAPAGGMAFREFLTQVTERSRQMFQYRRYPFTEALARFGSGTEGNPTAEAGITYLRLGRTGLSGDGLDVRMLGILPSGWTRRPLMLWLFDEPDQLRARVDVDAAVFEPEAAHRLTSHYVRLLESVVAEPDIELADIELLGRDERRRVLVDWNQTRFQIPGPFSVPALIESQARRSPTQVAIAHQGESLSYAELDEQANQLARHLRQLGVRPGVPVAVCLQRSIRLVVTLLGILKAGAPYLPLDPEYPRERLRVMLDEARAPLLITLKRFTERLPSSRVRFVLLDAQAEVLARYAVTPPEAGPSADHLAYVIFTSGSTGVPKGVAMPHRALVNLLMWQQSQFVERSPVRTMQFASPSFDVAFQEIFSTLATGGTLLPVDEDTRRDIALLAEFIEREQPRRLFLPFLALSELARHLNGFTAGPADVEVITAGERLEITPAIRTLFARRPGWTLTNQYGPTESHVVTAHRLSGAPESWPTLPPIGRPIANARVYVLDERRNPMPVGIPGELYLGGQCLATGYLNRPKLTRERFVPDPYCEPAERLYRTGDLARWREDGGLDFLDRVDHQVKIRGFRIEPAEIEARLVEQPGIREAVVIAREDGPVGRQLVGYIVGETRRPSDVELRQHLERHLPDHMLPTALVTLPRLPLTFNGKLDRRALPAPDWDASMSSTYTRPRTDTEQVLADVWATVLGLERVGADDNFFRLGGHSLLAGEVVARARVALGRELPVRLLFAHPTVRGMASAIANDSGTSRDSPIPRAARLPLVDLANEPGGGPS